MAPRPDPQGGRAAVRAATERTEPARATVATAVRWTLRLLADRAPGGALEVRVPPFGVVQCVAGPRHTRGTPASVVETDPQTWLSLATGTEAWAVAVASGRVSASGERADLAPFLPLLDPQEPDADDATAPADGPGRPGERPRSPGERSPHRH